ncbi:MAG: nuclear transport factor 2 family protein [Solirubrobacteraceae bacterium]
MTELTPAQAQAIEGMKSCRIVGWDSDVNAPIVQAADGRRLCVLPDGRVIRHKPAARRVLNVVMWFLVGAAIVAWARGAHGVAIGLGVGWVIAVLVWSGLSVFAAEERRPTAGMARSAPNDSCVRCRRPVDGSLWCPACSAELNARKIDPVEPSQIMATVQRYKELFETGSMAKFFDVFASDVVAEYPQQRKSLSRAQLEVRLESIMPRVTGCEVTLDAAFADGDYYWLTWHLKHPKDGPSQRYVEHVRLNEDGRICEVSAHYP